MKHILTASVLIAALGLAACTGETQLPTATGKGTVRAINAIPSSPAITFLIEERGLGTIQYKAATSTADYDDLDYNFNFEVLLAGDSALTRVASQHLDVVKDTDYTFVITGDIAAPTISLWESPLPVFDSNSTEFEVRFANLDLTLGSVDVYFAAPGIVPVLGEEIGTMAYGEVLPAAVREEGDYVLTLTAAGDPATVLFESETFTPVATTGLLFITFEPDPNDLGPVAVRGFNLTSGAAIPMPDAATPTLLRFFHANFELGPVDIYVDDPPTTPLVEDVVFGDITGDLPMPSDELLVTFTAANNIGSILLDSNRTLVRGSRNQLYLIQNSAGADVLVDYVPDYRPVETLAKVSLMNTAAIDVSLDIYIVPTGELIDELNPSLAALPVGLDPIPLTLVEGSFDFYVTPTGEKTVLAGPIALDVALGDVVDIVLYENADPSVVDVVFPPVP